MTTADDTELLDLIPPEAEIVRRIVDEVRRYPRIRRPLLRFLAADDFDELIATTRENSDNISLILERMGVIEREVQRIPVMEDRISSLEETVQRIDSNVRSLQGSVGQLQGSVGQLQGSVGQLQGSVGQLQGSVGQLQGSVGQLQGSVGQLRGDSYENKCAAEIEGILDGYLKNAVLADRKRITEAFRNARGNNLITRDEFLEHYRPDVIARADYDDDETVGLAVVEVSVTFNREDLEAASRRAELIGRVTGVPTAAFLATHHEWPAEMDADARELGVVIIRHVIPEYAI